MAVVFLSHSSKDKDLARRIAEDLKQHGIQVWFDEWEIKVGDSITQKIERGLTKARFVAVLLTNYSVKSGWVEKEWQSKIGEEAKNRKVIILPIRGEKCRNPSLLKDKRYADLTKGYQSGIKDLLKAIDAHTEGEHTRISLRDTSPAERMTALAIGGIPIPCFFPSISGAAKNVLSPFEHLKILMALKYPLLFISAYDISNAKRNDRLGMQKLLEKATSRGQIILLDSGLYEKRWLRTKSWPKHKFHETLRNTPCHLAFCYDNPSPKGNMDEIVSWIVDAVRMDQKKGEMNVIAPVVHAQYPTDFPAICNKLVQQINPPLIAVPERELGEGVQDVAQTIRSIRETLNGTGQYYPLHIFGAGNPLSILIYTASGADSFDGLDWCQTVVDHSTGRLYHCLQLDFFADQTTYGSQKRLPYLTRVFAHNVVFYQSWMATIRNNQIEGTIGKMIEKFVPPQTSATLRNLISD